MSEIELNFGPLMPEKEDYAIALCGAGGIVNDAHLPAYRKAGFKIAGIYDQDEAKAAQTAANFEIEKVYGSLQQLVEDRAVDIVDIAVPATENLRVIETVAAAGKSMLIQKPLAEDMGTVEDTVMTIDGYEVIAAVNQQMRWEPGVRACRDLLERGLLGELFNIAFLIFVDTPWHLWDWLKEKPTIDVLYHSIHYLDTIRFLTGCEPETLFCDGSSLPGYDAKGETRLCLHLRFADQLRATVLTNHHAAHGIEGQQSEFRVEGLGGAAVRKMGLLMDYPTGVPDAFRFTCESLQGRWQDCDFPATWFPDAFIGPMASLMRCLNGEIETPETDVHDNLKTLRLVFAAYESMRKNTVVQLG